MTWHKIFISCWHITCTTTLGWKMKLFTPALLLLCVRALCTTGSCNPRHPLLFSIKTHPERQSESHQVFKRQADSNEENHCYSVEIGILCTNGLANGAKVYQRCNDSFDQGRSHRSGFKVSTWPLFLMKRNTYDVSAKPCLNHVLILQYHTDNLDLKQVANDFIDMSSCSNTI